MRNYCTYGGEGQKGQDKKKKTLKNYNNGRRNKNIQQQNWKTKLKLFQKAELKNMRLIIGEK